MNRRAKLEQNDFLAKAVSNAEIMAKNSQVDSKNSAVLHHYGKVLRCTTDITTGSVHIVVNYSEKSAEFFENWAIENESPGRRSGRNALRARAILDSLENDISKMRQAEMNRIFQQMREWGEEEVQKECQKMAKIHGAAYQIKYSKYPNQNPSLVYKPLSRKSGFLS